jgi:hypothetical protein
MPAVMQAGSTLDGATPTAAPTDTPAVTMPTTSAEPPHHRPVTAATTADSTTNAASQCCQPT